MSVYRRGPKWYAYIVVDGRRVRRSAGTRAEALALEHELREHARVPSRGLEEALVEFLKGPARGLKNYRGLLSVARHVRPFLTQKTIQDAPDAARAMTAAWVSTLSVATINRRLALLRRLCSLAFEWGWTESNVGQRIKLLPGERRRDIYLLAPDVERLALHCRHLGAACTVMLAAYTGMRRGELLKLAPANYRDGWLVIDAATKSGKPRAVPVADRVRDICERWLPLPVTDTILRNRFEAAREASGLAHVRFHDLRHTTASLLVQAGVPLRTVGELLGHASVSTTMRYAHLAGDHLEQAVRGAFDSEFTPQSAPQRKTRKRVSS